MLTFTPKADLESLILLWTLGGSLERTQSDTGRTCKLKSGSQRIWTHDYWGEWDFKKCNVNDPNKRMVNTWPQQSKPQQRQVTERRDVTGGMDLNPHQTSPSQAEGRNCTFVRYFTHSCVFFEGGTDVHCNCSPTLTSSKLGVDKGRERELWSKKVWKLSEIAYAVVTIMNHWTIVIIHC